MESAAPISRIALVGAGPASLTVARDLAPLGYQCTVFDQDPKAGGMMRTQIPKFRLPDAVIDDVVNRTFDLFVALGATDAQLDFPIVYASALEGWATSDLAQKSSDLKPLFEAIIKHVPVRNDDPNGPLQLQICSLDYSSYVGRIGIGRITRGTIKSGQQVAVVNGPDAAPITAKVNQVQVFKGLERTVVDQAEAGDIVAISGIEAPRISDTLCAVGAVEALPPLSVDEPTVSMTFQVNNSPFAGKEGKFVTSRQIRDRLQRPIVRASPIGDDEEAAGLVGRK